MLHDDAASHPLGVILMVVTAIILAMLLLIICLGFFPLTAYQTPEVPAIFVITDIIHIDDKTHHKNFDSRMIIRHAGTATYRNAELKADIYRNGRKLPCVLETLHGTDFIDGSIHLGVQWIGYAGVDGDTWLPGEMSAIDLTDGTFRPGDIARLDVIDKNTSKVISRHVFRIP